MRHIVAGYRDGRRFFIDKTVVPLSMNGPQNRLAFLKRNLFKRVDYNVLFEAPQGAKTDTYDWKPVAYHDLNEPNPQEATVSPSGRT